MATRTFTVVVKARTKPGKPSKNITYPPLNGVKSLGLMRDMSKKNILVGCWDDDNENCTLPEVEEIFGDAVESGGEILFK